MGPTMIMINEISFSNRYTDLVVDMELGFRHMLHDFRIVEEDDRRLKRNLKCISFIIQVMCLRLYFI